MCEKVGDSQKDRTRITLSFLPFQYLLDGSKTKSWRTVNHVDPKQNRGTVNHVVGGSKRITFYLPPLVRAQTIILLYFGLVSGSKSKVAICNSLQHCGSCISMAKKLTSLPSPGELTPEANLSFRIPLFSKLPYDEKMKTSSLFCHGVSWWLELELSSFRSSEILFRGSERRCIVGTMSTRNRNLGSFSTFTVSGLREIDSTGLPLVRNYLLTDCDTDGTLTVTVRLQVLDDTRIKWKPVKSFATKMERLFKSKQESDATFVLRDHRFDFHRWIFHLLPGTFLADLVQQASPDCNEFPITDTDPDLFEMLLYFLYTEELPPHFEEKDHAIELCKLADRFGCIDLKLLVESRIVDSELLLFEETAMEMALFADSFNCALLREAAVKLIVANLSHLPSHKGWDEFKESKSLLSEVVRTQAVFQPHTSGNPLEYLSVGELRNLASEKGLEIDGSREQLINLLKAHPSAKDK